MFNHIPLNSMNERSPVFPDFIIGGAQKCGTSSLAIQLDRHPNIACSVPKEPDFFSSNNVRMNNSDYAAFFPDVAPAVCKFEASTGYFTDAKAASLIEKTMGSDVKFIFILRDPVDRAISAYYHMLKHNAEKRDIEEVFGDLPGKADEIYDFENDALKTAQEKGGIDNRRQHRYDDHFLQFRYAYNSLYSRHYQVYAHLFGEKNILLLDLDKLAAQPVAFFQKVTDFIGVQPFSSLPDGNAVHNKTRLPFYVLYPQLRKSMLAVSFFKQAHRIAGKLKCAHIMYRDAPDVSDEIKVRLGQLLVDERAFLKEMC